MNADEALLYSKSRGTQRAAYQLYLHKYIAINENDVILDAGCGAGEPVYEMGKIAKSVVGFDKSKDMIDVARKKFQRSNTSYEVADIVNCLETFPNWKGAFNKIVSVHVLHWVKEKKQALCSIYNCLQPGGQCFLLYSGPTNRMIGFGKDNLPYYLENHSKWKQYLKGYEHKAYINLTLDEDIALLKSVGFDVVEGDLHTPCDEIEIYSKDDIRGLVHTIMGHVKYVPEQYQSEILEDATDWCYEHFPVNQRGNQYIGQDIYVIRAKKGF